MDTLDKKNPKARTYFVNGEAQETIEHKLTVGDILTNAGFLPPVDYRLIRDSGDKTFTDLAYELPIHEGERFTALFSGQTPTS